MKVTRVDSFAVRKAPAKGPAYWGKRTWGNAQKTRGADLSAEYPSPFRRRYIYSDTIDTTLVRITTDDGKVGWGEAKAPVAPEAVKIIIDQLLAPIVIGCDPREVTLLWERMYAGMRVRGHDTGFYLEAISGIDIALWDLTAQAAGIPLYQALGGAFRNPVRVYASGIPALPLDASDEEWEDLQRSAKEIKERGFTALKVALGQGIAGDLRSTRLIREAVGSDFILFADAAGVYDVAQALRIGSALQDLNYGFFEMPIAPELLDGYERISKHLKIPLALDSLANRFQVKDFLMRGALGVVQPDVCRAGGVTESRRIAELADTFGAAFAPHVSIGSNIHFTATAHLAAAMPNTLIGEFWCGNNPLGDELSETPLDLQNGYLRAPEAPGLGVIIRADRLA
jgi:D-arabinonate dehydratase/D-galactarolactone cycloisomerase